MATALRQWCLDNQAITPSMRVTNRRKRLIGVLLVGPSDDSDRRLLAALAAQRLRIPLVQDALPTWVEPLIAYRVVAPRQPSPASPAEPSVQHRRPPPHQRTKHAGHRR